ncbi:hypothetical protein BN997_02683 [Oceanobacillus oncorhynchi]|uniref:Uncharacterized protein n=1 Tax=Oceanobacillus oncorhynchi TaxID=545501 RepID=A0A0A1MTG0_9BACI|nr:hypothetical protein BN997_02683 [Oceanobacillus oncorhynchi]
MNYFKFVAQSADKVFQERYHIDNILEIEQGGEKWQTKKIRKNEPRSLYV